MLRSLIAFWNQRWLPRLAAALRSLTTGDGREPATSRDGKGEAECKRFSWITEDRRALQTGNSGHGPAQKRPATAPKTPICHGDSLNEVGAVPVAIRELEDCVLVVPADTSGRSPTTPRSTST